jgi:hypothetical protein
VTIIHTTSGEDLTVGPEGQEAVTVSVRCPRFGRISHVRLTHEQAASLAGALTGIVLEQGAATWGLAGE